VGIPQISCLTAPDGNRCKVCPSALQSDGEKNYRRNTGAAIVVEDAPGQTRLLLIDCGKTFGNGAIEFFPRHGLYDIDALLLTHDHADACHGLDDLRALTFKQGPSPIRSPIPVHASPDTSSEILRMFAYLEDPRHSSGHGIAPFTWKVFDPSNPFRIPSCGNIEVTPLPVEHGRDHAPVRQPYICMGFRLNDFSYISDASAVPEETKKKVDGTRVLVLDALRERPHPSHLNFEQAKLFVRSLVPPPDTTYLIGMSHDTDHYWLADHLKKWSKEEGINVLPAYGGLKINLQEAKQSI